MKAKEMCAEINNKHSDFLFSLYERWLDEKEYENINDYLIPIQKSIPLAYEMTKRPFGVKVKAEDMNILVSIKSKGNSAQIYYTQAK